MQMLIEKIRQRTYFPTLLCNTIGHEGLNFSVRHALIIVNKGNLIILSNLKDEWL